MSFVVGLVFDFLLLILLVPLCMGFLYLANFQRTILEVGKRLGPKHALLVPRELRRAITPRKLSLLVASSLAVIAIIFIVGAMALGWLVPVLAVLVIFTYGFTYFISPLPYVPEPCSGHFVGQIAQELERKHQHLLAVGEIQGASEIAELAKRLTSLRDLAGGISKA